VKIKTFDDVLDILSLPLMVFGLYICCLNYSDEEYQKMCIVGGFTVMMILRWAPFLRKHKKIAIVE
jgi:hypothetical protein